MKINSTPVPAEPPTPTLSSLCNWWMTTKEESLPGICHWFIHPQHSQPRVSFSFSHNQAGNGSSFTPIGYTGQVGMIDMTHPVHSTASISLILILGSVLFILLVTAFITCITRRKRVQQQNEDEFMSQRVSDHIQRRRGQKKDPPPNYVTVIQMKKEEEEDLPSYSEAISMESVMSDIAKTEEEV